MLRRVFSCVVLPMLLLAPACKKKGDEPAADDAKTDKADKAAVEPAQQPTPTPTPVAPTPESEPAAPAGDSGASKTDSGGAGSGGGPAPQPREDLSCDPTERGACLEGEQCIGGQGCNAEWTCDATIVCKKGVKEYCGCDGRTFEAVYGNCPWKKYQYEGPCK